MSRSSHSTWRRRLAAAFVVGTALGSAVACGSDDPKPAAAATTTPSPSPEAPKVLWPLTGEESGPVEARPAVAMKIENSIDARPQTGLNAADLVWEEVVEGGITRYVAVFHSELPAEIGPVRSIRPMDAAIAGPLHGLMAFSGGQQVFIDMVAEAGLQLVSNDAGAGGFHRIDSRPAPHNVYASLEEFVAQADAQHSASPTAQFDIAAEGDQPTAVAAGRPADALQLTLSGLSDPRWTWSAADGAWLRAEGTTPAVDADGAQLQAANVVVLRVDLVDTGRRDAAHNPVLETVLVGAGQAAVASGGSTIEATWSKASATDRVELTAADGSPVLLAPGNTWIELVPNGSGSVAVG